MVQLHREREAFSKLGVQIVVVGHSNPRYAKAFIEETKVDLPIYVDEKRVAYQALDFKRPLLAFLNLKVFKRAAEARKEGFTQPGVWGDAFQLGGVVLLLPDGSMPYRYASQFAGDHPKVEDLKTEVRKALS